MYQKVQQYPNEYPTLGDLLSNGVKVFDDSWSTYVPEHKKQLIQKIIDRYYFEEIGVDTPDRFVFNINAHMRQIMPYYNQMYQSELININPMLTHSINASTRTIENLLKKANTTNDRIAKAIRDFAGVTAELKDKNKKGEFEKNVNATGNELETGDVTTDTTENAEKNITDNLVGKVIGKVDENKTTDGTEKTTGNTLTNTRENGTITVTTDGEKIVTPELTEETVKEYGAVETTDKNTIGTSDSNTTKIDNWTESTIDDANTKTNTILSEHTDTSGKKDYADTPQKQLDEQKLRSDYLTNVTWTDEDTEHASTTAQTQKYDDKLDKTHEGNGSNVSKDRTNEQLNGSVTKSGSDTETTTRTGTETTTTDETQTTEKSNTVNTDENFNKNVVTDETVSTITNSTEDKTEDRKIRENETRDTHSTQTKNLSTDTKDDENTTGTTSKHNTQTTNQQTREKRNTDEITATTEKIDSEQTTDSGETSITSGFMNVSSSALLEAFRRTFLNIDAMIVEELATNFLLTM